MGFNTSHNLIRRRTEYNRYYGNMGGGIFGNDGLWLLLVLLLGGGWGGFGGNGGGFVNADIQRGFDQNAVMSDRAVKQALCEIEALLSGRGRVILRKSGTEPVVRIMVECESEEDCLDYAERIARAIEERGHLAL